MCWNDLSLPVCTYYEEYVNDYKNNPSSKRQSSHDALVKMATDLPVFSFVSFLRFRPYFVTSLTFVTFCINNINSEIIKWQKRIYQKF